MKRWLVALVVVAFLVFTAYTALTQVRPGELAVVRRWGRILPDRPGPGLHVGWPWGIDRVDRVPIRSVRSVAVGVSDDAGDGSTSSGHLLTGDHNLVNVQVKVDYVVREEKIGDYLLHAHRTDDLVARVTEAAVAEWIAGRTVDDARQQGKALLPAALVKDVNDRLDDYGVGVRVERLSVPRLNPPDEVRDAFEAVASAQSKMPAQINQAATQAKRTLDQAKAEKYRIEQNAAEYAKDQVRKATAEAHAFLGRLEQYRTIVKTQPDYINVLWQDEIARLFAKLRETGHVDLLDNRLGTDGLNITQFPQQKK